MRHCYAIALGDSNEVLRFTSRNDRNNYLSHDGNYMVSNLAGIRRYWNRDALADDSEWVAYIDKKTGVEFETFGYN